MTGYVKIKAQPGAAQDGLCGIHGDAIKVRLRARAIDGKANAALVEFLAGHLGVARSRVAIKSGASSRIKTVAVEGIDSAVLAERLAGEG
jgi:hypothetical protein